MTFAKIFIILFQNTLSLKLQSRIVENLESNS